MTTLCITASGTEYEVTRTAHQDIVVRWEDRRYTGPEGMNGGRVKVWEHCRISTQSGDVEVGQCLLISGTDRYSDRDIAWKTTPIVSLIHNGVSIDRLPKKVDKPQVRCEVCCILCDEVEQVRCTCGRCDGWPMACSVCAESLTEPVNPRVEMKGRFMHKVNR